MLYEHVSTILSGLWRQNNDIAQKQFSLESIKFISCVQTNCFQFPVWKSAAAATNLHFQSALSLPALFALSISSHT
jgi:hypothetical protein